MIETEQTILVNAGITSVWDYAHDINKWANLMPGLQSCEITDADNSFWTLKVGAGGMVRTVRVRVHVTEWAGPTKATFTFKLEGDPVEGGGAYVASVKGSSETEVALTVRVSGSGPMAPMWEAMGKPLLPSLARGFAERLKAAIEKAAKAKPRPHPSTWTKVWAAIRTFWRSLFKPAAL